MTQTGLINNRHFLIRLIASYSILLIIILSMGLYMYYTSLHDVRSNLHEQGLLALNQSIQTMDASFQIMDAFTNQVSGNSTILRLISAESSDNFDFYVTASKAQNFLKYFILSEDLLPISDYFIFLPRTEYLLSSTIFSDSDLYYRQIKSYHTEYYSEWLDFLKDRFQYRCLHKMDSYTGKSNVSFYYLTTIIPPTMPSSGYGALCFEVDYQQLKKIFLNLPFYDTGFLYITDQTGKELFHIKSANSPNLNETIFMNVTASAPDEKDYSSVLIDGHRMLITNASSSYNNWNYYLIQPADMTLSSLIQYQQTYIAIILFTCVLSFCVIFLLSRRNIKPVIQINHQLETTLQEHSSLQQKLEAQKPIIYHSYAERIMTGQVNSPDEMEYIRDYLKICTINRKFCVLYLVLYFDQPEDAPACNTFHNYQEEFRHIFRRYFGEDTLLYEASSHEYALLLSSLESEDFDRSVRVNIHETFLALCDELTQTYSIYIYGGLGNRNADLMYTWKSYLQAQEASAYAGNTNLLQDYIDINQLNSSYYYPLELEEKLTKFITAGNEKQVNELLKLIQHENFEKRSLSIPMMKYFISDLRSTLVKIRFSAEGEEKSKDLLPLPSIDEKLNGDSTFSSISEAALALTHLFQPKTEGNQLILSIQTYIRENYTDASLCLNKISDTFHISESYFSYLFKAKTGENFSEYLEHLRMEQAMHLLCSTDISISNLYLEVGYNNANSFRRAFKKIHGMSPKAAREAYNQQKG